MKKSRNPISRRISMVVILIVALSAVSCNLPGCGEQPEPTTPGPTASPTVDVSLLPPTAPRLVARQPSAGGELRLDGSIDLYFDQPMDQQSVSTAIRFDPPLEVDFTWVDDSTLRLTPRSGQLQRATRYDVTIDASARSESALPLDDALAFEVQTVGFLEVGEVVPAPDAEAVETGSVITVLFNRPVVPLTLVTGAPDLPQPLRFEPDIPGEGEWLNTSIYQWKPSAPLAGGQTYMVTVEAGLSDQTGGELQEAYSWSFTTLPPDIVSVTPTSGERDIGLDAPVVVEFNQPMDTASAQAAFSLLETTSSQAVRGTFEWDQDRRIMTFKPAGLLALDGIYRVRVGAEARSASGGLTLSRDNSWVFNVVHTPAVAKTDPPNGAKLVSSYWGIRIQFTAPMDLETLKPDLLEVDPPLPDDANFYYSSYDWSYNIGAALEPSTVYTVTLKPGAADPYGHRIRDPYTFSFETGPLSPLVQLNVQDFYGLYDASQPTQLFVLHRNVDYIDFTLARLSLAEFGRLTSQGYYYGPVDRYVPPADQIVRTWRVEAGGALNEANYVKVPVSDRTDGSLEPGIYMLIADAPQIEGDVRHFMIVVNANLTLKTSFDESLVWLTDLQSGQPIANAPVTFYGPNFGQVAQGVTDANGVLETNTPHQDELWEQQYAIVDNGQIFAVAMSGWTEGLDPWQFGLPSDFQFQDYSLYLYTDRPLYRPGQEVYFKGVLRGKNDVSYSLPGSARVPVVIYNDQGDTIYNQSLALSGFGTFEGILELDDAASLGFYNIEVEIGNLYIRQGFQVAEYRKPEFIVNVTPAQDAVLAGETLEVVVDAEFFFGGPVSDAEVSWNVLADTYFFDYEGPGYYGFADFDPDAPVPDQVVPGYGELIADGTGQTDAEGRYVISLPASLDDAGTSRRFTIEATVTDINGQPVSNRAEVIVHKGQFYVGVSPDVYVGVVNQEQSASLIVVDWDSQPVAGQEVKVEILERRWNSVQELDDLGRVQWTWTVQEIPVGDAQTVRTDSSGKASVSFVPPTGGVFKIRATVTDSLGNSNRGSATMWVSGYEYVIWRQANNDRIDLISDKQTYQPGDTAEILIASPFQGDDVKALVTIERGSVLSHEVISLPTNSYVYNLPITGDLAPNVYVSVVIVKGVDDTNKLPAFKMGAVGIEIEPSQQTISLSVTPGSDQVGPGESVTYRIEATDYQGRPVDAEVSLALVDLATLQLAPPNSGPILDHFYGDQRLGVRTAIPLVYLVDRRNQELFDMGKGGGGGGGEGFFEVRTDFRDTAFWQAQVRTEADGVAEVTVTLPDNLTTWRMDARAVTQSTLVGQTEVDVVATKPLLIRPVTPRFFIVQDEVTLTAVVNNNTGGDIDATVSLQAISASIDGDAIQNVAIPAGGRVEVAWPIVVNANAEWVDLVFQVEGGGLSDASRPPLGDPAHEQMLPVYRYEVPETVGTAGQLIEAGSRVEGVVLPPTYEVTQGQLQVQIDPSLAASTVEGLKWLEHFPYECTEQTVSRFLPNVLTLRAFREFGLSDATMEANLTRVVNTGLQKLYAQQHVDGGWGWFVSSSSNPTVTAYVIQGMVVAQDAGINVEQRVLNEGLSFLRRNLRSMDVLDDVHERDRQAYLLYVMAKAGQPDASRTVQLYEAREGLQHWAKALLAQTLWTIDPNDARLADIQSDLMNSAILSATGAHWEEPQPDYWNWNTDTRSTAIILDTFALLWPTNDIAPNIVRWLMVARQGGHWETTQETAWALIGLTDWMVATKELDANYDWTFTFNGRELGSGQARRDTVRQSSTITIEVGELMRDHVNRLVFDRTAGDGRLYYTAHLTAYLPVEQIDPLSRGIIISRRYLNDAGQPVTQGRVGDIITVELSIIAPNDLYYVVVDDYYPAGAEPVDVGLLTESVLGQRPTLKPDAPLEWGWGWWWFSETDLRDEKAVLFADYLPAGTYQYTYQVRLGLEGVFRVIPPVGWEFYFPEVYGRGAGMLFTVQPQQ